MLVADEVELGGFVEGRENEGEAEGVKVYVEWADAMLVDIGAPEVGGDVGPIAIEELGDSGELQLYGVIFKEDILA